MTGYRTLGLLLAGAAAVSAQTFSFLPGATFPAGNGPLTLATGDFNGDGNPDLAVGNISSETVGIYLGNGIGGFTPGDTVSVPGCEVGYLAAGNFIKNGYTSILAGCQFQNTVWVLPGLGNGHFGSPISTALPNVITFFGLSEGYAQNYGVADFNKDGVPDLVIGLIDSSFDIASATVSLLLSNGDGTFQSPIPILSSASIPLSLVVGDFNRDGNPDVAIASEMESGGATQLQVFLGNGKGAFEAGQNLSLPETELAASTVADVNGDRIPDIILSGGSADSKTGSIYVYIGAGDGTFTPLNSGQLESIPIFGILAADLRGRGTVDLVESIPAGSGSGTSFALQVSAGNGDGTFQAPVPIVFPSGLEPWPFTMLAGDWNGDGLTDLAFVALPADFQESKIFSGGGGGGLQTLLMGYESFPAGNLVTIQNGLTPAPALSVASAKLQFSYMAGGAAPAAQSIAISNSGTGTLNWTATSNSSWLTVSPASGSAPASLTISVVPGSLSPATYTGAVQINAAGAAGSPQTIAVTLTISPSSSAPTITGVVNGASFQPGIESGSWVTIQGSNLSNTNPGRTWTTSEVVNGNLPTSLDNTSVTIDGKPAFVYYISPTQLNVQAPTDSATGSVPVVVTNNGQVSAQFSAQLASAAPAFFLYSGTSYAIAQHYPDYADVGNPNLISYTIAAHPGDVLILWATGFGATNPPTPAGIEVTGTPAVATVPMITVGGVPVSVINAVLSPGSAGLYQIAIQLPASVPTGTVAIQASVGGAISPAGISIYVSAQ